MKLKHFTLEEFRCKGSNCCGRSAPMNPQHLLRLDLLRAQVNSPIIVNSGFRCNTHNREVRGAAKSYHTLGLATDITAPKKTIDELLAIIQRSTIFEHGGVIVYTTFIHVDSRDLVDGFAYFADKR